MVANTYPKSWYMVFECALDDPFQYDSTQVLFEGESLGDAHSFAYKMWLGDKRRAYTIIQPYDDSCRGAYSTEGDQE